MRAPQERNLTVAALAIVGALVLVGSLSFTWLKLRALTDTPGQEIPLSGWSGLETGDALFVFIAAIVIGLVVSRHVTSVWLLSFAALALAVVVTFFATGTPQTELIDALGDHEEGLDKPAYGPGGWIAVAGGLLLLVAGLLDAKVSRSQEPAA